MTGAVRGEEGDRGGRHPLAFLAVPFTWFCLRLGLPPMFFTLLSLPLAAVAFWLIAQGYFFFALFAVFAAAGVDAMDGAVARATGTTSKAGGYLDSMTDRVVDLAILLAIMLALDETRGWIVGSLALFGTLTTSAAKWRLLQDLPSAPGKRDWFARTDRYVVILAGILVAAVVGTDHQGLVLFVLLVVLALVTNLNVLGNTLRALRLLRHDGS